MTHLGPTVPEEVPELDALDDGEVKEKLRWKEELGGLTDAQRELFWHMNSYRDMMLPQRTLGNGAAFREMYVLHAVNHALKARTKVIKNNTKLKANPDLEILDQGFTRPKVLIVLPYKSCVAKVVDLIIRLTIDPATAKPGKSVRKHDKYKEEYDPDPGSDASSSEDDDGLDDVIDDEEEEEEEVVEEDDASSDGSSDGGSVGGAKAGKKKKTTTATKTKKQTKKEKRQSKRNRHPNAEHRKLFEGDTDDCFRLGISLTRTTVNLYSDFYTADILIASPLGLRLIIGADGERHQEYDFLSSIEVTIIDQAESMLMQNWEHVLHMMAHTNLQPRETRNTDFSRLQRWSVEGWAKHFRQTILLSSQSAPEFNLLYKKHCSNLYGEVRFSSPTKGSITTVASQIPQSFHRVHAATPSDAIEARFRFFVDEVLQQLNTAEHSGVLVYIPSYFDFVRIRNHCRTVGLSFGQICEYTTGPNVTRARSYLYHGQRKFTLYTERFHYHFRPRLRGVNHVVFYGLPTFSHYYSELLNAIKTSPETTCSAVFTRFDGLALERVVGTARAQRMLTAERDVHLFA